MTILLFLVLSYCSCEPRSTNKDFKEANTVFLGQIVEVTQNSDSDFPNAVKFKIEKQWKGTKQSEIVILVAYDVPKWCGDLPLSIGMRYIIFSYKEKQALVTYADCGPNIIATAQAIKKINSLGRRY